MSTKDTKSDTPALTPDSADPVAKQGKDWQKNFPQAEAAHASRDDYQQTADARRARAQLDAAREQARQAKVSGEPTPTGEGEDVHQDEAELSKHDGEPSEDPARAIPGRDPQQQ